MADEVFRVIVTPAAAALIEKFVAEHCPMLFHQSGGRCDGSAPMCFPAGEFMVGGSDVKLGSITGAPFYMSESQFEYWHHTPTHHRLRTRKRRHVLAGASDGPAFPDPFANF